MQNESKETCNLQPVLIEQKKETKKEPLKVSDYKILKDYAIKRGASNIQAYINKLISLGSAVVIIREHKKAVANNKAMVEAVAKQISTFVSMLVLNIPLTLVVCLGIVLMTFATKTIIKKSKN